MSAMSELDMDRQRVDALMPTATQRYAVAALIGHCESIAASGRLTTPAEQSLRLLIAETASAFKMQVREHELSVFEEQRL